MISTIIKTKLYIPPARPIRVPRPRLIDRLNTRNSLVLISAPAGFGKTTLLSEWIPQNQHCITWVSLDEGDNDFPRFWVYLIYALQMLRADLGQGALSLIQSPQSPPATTMLATLINEILDFEGHFSLVLDDYHAITTPDIHQALAYLLEHMPPQMHLVISSRADPPLPLARRRARNQLTEIRADDLRFTADEAAAFLNQGMGLNLPAQDIAALEARNEGWIAGLQLAALSMQGREDTHEFIQAFSGSHRHVLSYLVEEVLNRRPKGTLDFLLQTSILDRLTGPLCDALTGRSDGQAVLAQLEQARLFIVPLDDEGKWYRYHHLFADVLRIRLRQVTSHHPSALPVEISELHRRASLWYEHAGFLEDSMRHALAASDSQLAASLVERCALPLLLRSELILLGSWLEHLPGEIIQSRPRLALAQAWMLLFGNHLESAEQALRAPVLRERGLSAELTGELALLQAIMARFKREPEVAKKRAHEALKYLPEDSRAVRASALLEIGLAYKWLGDRVPAMQILSQVVALGESPENWTAPLVALEAMRLLHAQEGRLSRVAKTCEQAIRMVAGWDILPPAAGMAYVGLGEVQCERNDLQVAAHTLQQGLRLLVGTIEDEPVIHGYFALARIAQAQGDPAEAHASVQRAEGWFQQVHFARPWTMAHLEALHVRLWIWQDNLALARQWAQDSGLQVQNLPHELTDEQRHEYLTLVRLRIAEGRIDAIGQPLGEALLILDHLLQAAEAEGRMGTMIEIYMLRALALHAQGSQDAALDSLDHALHLAEPEGYTRIFLDEGKPMHAFLLKAGRLRGDSLRKPVQRLLIEFEKYLPAQPDPDHETDRPVTLIEPLTPRELEILRPVADGASNRAIAQQLYLSTGTVKVHLKHIFGKLGVSSRTQAVARARELNLL